MTGALAALNALAALSDALLIVLVGVPLAMPLTVLTFLAVRLAAVAGAVIEFARSAPAPPARARTSTAAG